MSQPTMSTVTIANGGTTSTTYETQGATRGSFQMPATITGTACTVNVSNNGTNWTACPVEGNEVNPLTVAASGSYHFPVKAFSFRYMQFVMDAQGQAVTITLATRD